MKKILMLALMIGAAMGQTPRDTIRYIGTETVMETTWTTYERVRDECNKPGCCVIHYETLRQIGTVYEVLYVNMSRCDIIKQFKWSKRKIETNNPPLRTVTDSPLWQGAIDKGLFYNQDN